MISDETLQLFPQRTVSDIRNYVRMKLNNAEKAKKPRLAINTNSDKD